MRRESFKAKWRLLTQARRPNRSDCGGLSASELKTLLRRCGFKIRRDFFIDCNASKGSRLYRFRWWSAEFFVDESCQIAHFDRWANSTERTYSWDSFKSKFLVEL
jgi:hypothetical protein